jgi:hypothetical protein
VAAQDACAPSWEFLQERWAGLQRQGRGAGAEARVAEEGAQLLLVISHAAEKFPPAQAQRLAADLLEVRGSGAADAAADLAAGSKPGRCHSPSARQWASRQSGSEHARQ